MRAQAAVGRQLPLIVAPLAGVLIRGRGYYYYMIVLVLLAMDSFERSRDERR